ncbi:MAG: hypothetical protein JEZ14_14450 [Marinilabiliaceae bacterium]|nr:hypothetical protein [Marinilabiliaceae bacterium]
MYRLIMVFVIALSNLIVVGQDPKVLELEKQMEQLNTISDINKKRFEVGEISQFIKNYLLRSDSAWDALTHIKSIYRVQSDDRKVQVAGYLIGTYPDAVQFEWFIRCCDQPEIKVYHFSDELHRDGSNGDLLPNFKLQLQTIVRNQISFYQLVVSKGHKSETILMCDDVMLKSLFEEVSEASNNEMKEAINRMILERLNQLWLDESTMANAFRQFKRMKTLFSQDKKVKICTYNVQKEGFTHDFYGAVIRPAKNNVSQVYSLIDQTNKIRSPERASLSNEKWFGAVYIDLVETVVSDRTYYTLLGYKGNDEFVKTRVLDVMYFQNNRLRFGSSIFKNGRLTRHRMIYKYSAGATMMMRYDRKLKMIVMDNLAPAQSFYRGVHRYYGPDFSYNAYRFKKGYWELKQDIDLRNAKGANAPLNSDR